MLLLVVLYNHETVKAMEKVSHILLLPTLKASRLKPQLE